ALDLMGGRMFITDLTGSVYSANLDGSDKKALLIAKGNLTGIAYAEVPVVHSNGPAPVRATASDGKGRAPKPLPAPNSDFYEFAETLPAQELAILKKVRAFMESRVAPIINKYWVEDAFPFEILPGFKELNIGGLGIQGYGCAGGSQLLIGLVAMELARFDASIATFQGVHSGLAMGSIAPVGSEEQKQKWLPPV